MLADLGVPKEKTGKTPPMTVSGLISRVHWWATAPKLGQDEMTLKWGYLEVYADSRFRFNGKRSSDSKISKHISCVLV